MKQENKKPLYKKPQFWIILAGLALIIGMIVIGNASNSEKNKQAEQAKQEEHQALKDQSTFDKCVVMAAAIRYQNGENTKDNNVFDRGAEDCREMKAKDNDFTKTIEDNWFNSMDKTIDGTKLDKVLVEYQKNELRVKI